VIDASDAVTDEVWMLRSRSLMLRSESMLRSTNPMLQPMPVVTKFVKVLNAEKKLAWTDLDKVSFKKFVRVSTVEIKKSAWTGLDKVKKGLL
jgi:hypothetical protein